MIIYPYAALRCVFFLFFFAISIPIVVNFVRLCYLCRLTGSDKATQLKCARAWTAWELNVLSMICDPAIIEERLAIDDWVLAFAKTEW